MHMHIDDCLIDLLIYLDKCIVTYKNVYPVRNNLLVTLPTNTHTHTHGGFRVRCLSKPSPLNYLVIENQIYCESENLRTNL